VVRRLRRDAQLGEALEQTVGRVDHVQLVIDHAVAVEHEPTGEMGPPRQHQRQPQRVVGPHLAIGNLVQRRP
jgi:hypothetical protein